MKHSKKLLMVAGVFCAISMANAANLSATPVAATPVAATPVAATPVAAPKATTSVFTNSHDKISYTLGVDMGLNLKNNGIQINPDIIAQGLKDGMSGGENLKMGKAEMEETLVSFQHELQAKRVDAFKKMSEQNKTEGTKFFADNKAKPGVITLDNGIQYRVLTDAKGEKAAVQDVVTVNYEGRFINGQVFDSSYKRGTPATFPLGQVIPGWQKIIPLMPIGSTWEVYIPAELAYGQEGAAGVVGPNQSLIFKINVLSVKKSAPGEAKKG